MAGEKALKMLVSLPEILASTISESKHNFRVRAMVKIRVRVLNAPK
jgi:hypothetical protein